MRRRWWPASSRSRWIEALSPLLPPLLLALVIHAGAPDTSLVSQSPHRVRTAAAVRPRSHAEPSPAPRVVRAVRTHGPVTIDGALSEPLWSGGEPFTALTQRDPVEGAAPSQPTEVRIA